MRVVGPDRLARKQHDRLWSIPCALLLVFVLPANAIARSPEQARRAGLEAGARDGRNDGTEAGYAEAFAEAEQVAFAETLDELTKSGSVNISGSRKILIWAVYLPGGFLAQWLLLYVLRRVCGLPDIDWMVFPGRLTEINVTRELPPVSQNTLQRIIPVLLVIVMGGCSNRADEAWSRAYERQFDIDYEAGRTEGASHGSVDGRLAGINRAFDVAKRGEWWGLYTVHVVSAMLVGAVLGLMAQYIHLLSMRQSGQLNAMWSPLLVPGIRSSYAYSVFVRRREFMVWMKDEIAKLRASQRLRRAQLESVKLLVHDKAVTLSDLDAFVQARLIEAANAKMSEIVAAAEWEASSVTEAVTQTKSPQNDQASGGRRVEEQRVQKTPPEDVRETETEKPADRWMPMIDSVTYSAGE